MTTNQARRPDRKVPTRRLALEDAFAEVPRHPAGDGDLMLSHLGAALSAVFPDGEDYFVRSVRHFRDQVTDPDLKRQVAGFIGQESMHGREHRALNDRLAQLGYPTKEVEWITRKALTTRERVLSPLSNLALTAALEHFTATLAEIVLSDKEVRDSFGHPAVWDLFVWHALEESEHKAVAFDVYCAVGGTERMRVTTMKVARVLFVCSMALQMVVSLLTDPATYERGNLRRSWKRFRRSTLVGRETWRRLREYDRRGFHPEDRDTTALVEHWRSQLFGEQGTLNDKLAGAAA